MDISRDGGKSKGVRVKLSQEQIDALQGKASKSRPPLFGENVVLEPLGRAAPKTNAAPRTVGDNYSVAELQQAVGELNVSSENDDNKVVVPGSWEELEDNAQETSPSFQKVSTAPMNTALPPQPSVGVSDDDEWNDIDDNDLVLILNATRYIEEVLGAGKSDNPEMLAGSDLLKQLKQGLQNDLSNPNELSLVGDRLEGLFAHKVGFQSTRSKSKIHMENLSRVRGGKEVYITLEYPPRLLSAEGEILNVPQLWSSMCKKHQSDELSCFPSVDMLKQWILGCSRLLTWKLDMLDEINLLSEREKLNFEHRSEVRERISELNELKATLAELVNSSGKDSQQLDESTLDTIYAQLEMVEDDIDQAHEELRQAGPDEYTKFDQDTSVGLRTKASKNGTQSDEMSVVDMIVAMVLPRCDTWRQGSQSDSEFTAMMVECHQQLQTLWKKDFGRLPTQQILGSSSPSVVDKPHDFGSADFDAEEQVVNHVVSNQQQPKKIAMPKRTPGNHAEHLRPGYLGPQRERAKHPSSKTLSSQESSPKQRPTFSKQLEIAKAKQRPPVPNEPKGFNLSNGELDGLLSFIESDEHERRTAREDQGKKPAQELKTIRPDPSKMEEALAFVLQHVNSPEALAVADELSAREDDDLELELLLGVKKRVPGTDRYESENDQSSSDDGHMGSNDSDDEVRAPKDVVLVRPKQYSGSLLSSSNMKTNKSQTSIATRQEQEVEGKGVELRKNNQYFDNNTQSNESSLFQDDATNQIVFELAKQRDEAREQGDYEKADQLRDELLKLGVIVEDSKNSRAKLSLIASSLQQEKKQQVKSSRSVRSQRNKAKRDKKAAKKNRAVDFAMLIVKEFGREMLCNGIVDVAGGKGALSFHFVWNIGLRSTVIDPMQATLSEFNSKLVVRKALSQQSSGTSSQYDSWLHHNVSKHLDDGQLSKVSNYLSEIGLQQKQVWFGEELNNHQETRELLETCSLIVGLHPDEATEPIVNIAIQYNKPFAIVPCCIFPSQNPHRSHITKLDEFVSYLQQLAQSKGNYSTSIFRLPHTGGSNIVLIGKPAS